MQSSWGGWVAEAVEYYHTHHPNAETLTAASRATAMETVHRVLAKDMQGRPGCVERLGAILRFALEDEEFWQGNLRSLGALRKASGAGGYKWQSIESAMRRAKPRPPSPNGKHQRQYVTDRVPDGAIGYKQVERA